MITIIPMIDPIFGYEILIGPALYNERETRHMHQYSKIPY